MTKGRLKEFCHSQIMDHKTSVQIMSAVYCSQINAKNGKSPIISYKLISIMIMYM
jgi:hypothetical protein